MALTRKPGPAQAVSLIGQIPDPPQVPREVLDRFTSMELYQAQLKAWWSDFSDMLQRDRSQVQTQFTADETAAASNLKSIQAQIDAINKAIAALSTSGTGPTNAQFKALSDMVSVLSASISAHIASTSAHGTASPIVGESDAQSLDQKQIGLTVPGYGRFAPSVGYGRIPAGQTVTIGFSDFMIVTGTFTVDGTLNVDGTLVAL